MAPILPGTEIAITPNRAPPITNYTRAVSLVDSQAVLAAFKLHRSEGLTAAEAVLETGLGYTSVSARFAELKKMSALSLKQVGTNLRGEPVYERRLTRSGCT